MEDSTIQIYNVRVDEVKTKLKGASAKGSPAKGLTQGIHDRLHPSSMARAIHNRVYVQARLPAYNELVSWEHKVKIFL
ncbi:hypothetical protein C5167_030199 [Papaver somniferum]|nr:hypothetical protein C5167_030199 [Papaver somniferum]